MNHSGEHIGQTATGNAISASVDEAKTKAFPLALARGGERLRIAAFKTGKGLGKRLGDLGLHKGSVIDVVLHQRNGSVVVSDGNNRVALGAGAAQMIIVMLCPGKSGDNHIATGEKSPGETTTP
ncbi:FeoA family protein [Varunaivibrio sulfuroxidans]|uniref:Fe2+ transport system protein FeoA n=1 Tax=Varunaivibrio sulfuroxidans TaxID=1773489 RepID=A0A4R3JE45_9PROT|nr:FeoA family protein [Varunaivibrio sulfuroxidans]TCS64349.1 Fe2+ transport system protein FeoA [Varunaivibrio sulfuroxidans]WES31214.1 FeoA family protein [Varunaivibrio sulfuroxidans]